MDRRGRSQGRRKRFLQLSVALWWLAAASAATQPLRVVDAAGKPVGGARLEVWTKSPVSGSLAAMLPAFAEGETDAEGRSPIRLPARAGVLLVVDHPLYRPWAREVGGETTVVLEEGRSWPGKVRFRGGELRKGRLCATWQETLPVLDRPERFRRCTELSGQGAFRLVGLGSDEVEVKVTADGFLPLEQTGRLTSPPALRLRRGVTIAGFVRGPGAETPVCGAVVEAEGGSSSTSGEDGTFSVAAPELPATLQVSASGFRRRSIRVEKLPEGGVVAQLERGEQVRGTLFDESRKPIQEAELYVEHQRSASGISGRPHELELTEGTFRLDLPAPGIYRFRVRSPGFREEPIGDASIAPGESYALGDVVLSRGAGVQGVVVDALSAEPVGGVEIELLPAGVALFEAVLYQRSFRTVTGADGRFLVAGLEPGAFTLTATRAGSAQAAVEVDLETEAVEELPPIRLERGTPVRVVVETSTGQPRSGLLVRVLRPDQSALSALAEATTGEDGATQGLVLASGRYRVQVRGARLLLAQEIVVPASEEEQRVPLTIGGVRLAGRVTRGGEPVGGGSVALSSLLDPAEQRGKLILTAPGGTFRHGMPETRVSAEVAPDGSFTLDDPPTGAALAHYTSPEGVTLSRRVTIAEGERPALTIDLAGVTLRGRVFDQESGSGLSAWVRVFDAKGSELATQPTDSEGAFAAAGLAPGRYALRVSANGYAPRARADVEVGEETPPVEIPLENGRAASLLVRLTRETGRPAPWVPLILLGPGSALAAAQPSGSSGERRFEDLAPGTYTLVWSDGFSGAGASRQLSVGTGGETVFEQTLAPGGPVDVACDLALCAGRSIEALSVVAESGVDLAPHLSGVSTGLRFGLDGRVSLGRLAPGSYEIEIRSAGRAWAATFSVDGDGALVRLP